MTTLGIVGKTNSGKSTLAGQIKVLVEARDISFDLFDADVEAHRLYREDHKVISAIGERFPDSVQEGQVDTTALYKHFFVSNENREFIESIVFSALTEKLQERKQELENSLGSTLLLVDAALLFKAGWEKECDALLHVTVPYEVREERAVSRWMEQRDLTKTEAKERFTQIDALQPDAEEITKLAGDLPVFTIENVDMETSITALKDMLCNMESHLDGLISKARINQRM